MFNNSSFIGKWTGHLVYGANYGDLEGEKASFHLFIERSDESGFEGKAIDMEGVGVNKDVATVKGFLDNSLISFVKQYPTTLAFTEAGEVEIVSNKPSPEIHYTGQFDDNKQAFIGDWEMVWSEVKQGDGYIEYLNTGTWEMRKEAE